MKNEKLEIFNETQIEVLKDCVKYGIWGDAHHEFKGQDAGAIACCSNDIHKGGRFKGKMLSGLISGISATIDKHSLACISIAPDWWGDGSGDMIMFNMDDLETNWDDLVKWAKN